MNRSVKGFSIRSIVLGSFAAIVLTISIVGLFDHALNVSNSREVVQLSSRAQTLQALAGEIKYIVVNIQRLTINSVVSADQKMLLLAPSQANRFYEIIDEMSHLVSRGELDVQLQILRDDYRVFLVGVLSLSAQFLEGVETNHEKLTEINIKAQEFIDRLNTIAFEVGQISKQDIQEITSRSKTSWQLGFISLSVTLSVVLLVFIFLRSRLTRPIEEMIIFLRNQTDGFPDFSARMSSPGKGEVAELYLAFNSLLESLENTTVSKNILTEEIQERKKVEKELLRYKDELENLVEERSRSLEEATKQLHEEFSQRKQIETQLRQAQKMEALGSLAGGIAHDFNNILTPLIGFTDMTIRQVEKGSDAWENLEEVRDASYRAKELVGRILAFSRKGEQHMESVDFVSVLQEVIHLLRASIPATIDIHQQINQSELYILADSTQLHQVVMNLATNACDAMKKQRGVLSISLNKDTFVKRQHLINDTLPAGSYCRLSISDTGEGMTEDTMLRIFEPYFTTKGMGEGTGLGLSVVHGIVDSHNGHIDIRSSPGSGTTFTIYFPLLEDWEAFAQPEESEEYDAGGSGTILLVDDDPHITLMLKKELGGLGYTVRAFTDSPSALAVFKTNPAAIDLLITDQTMPEMTGMELSAQVLELRNDLPIILCTGYSENISSQDAKAIGIREYVLKPLILDDFVGMIQKILQPNRSLESSS